MDCLCIGTKQSGHCREVALVEVQQVGKLRTSQLAHQAGAYPGFCSMKCLVVFLLPPGWDASHCRIAPSVKFTVDCKTVVFGRREAP